MTGTYQIGLEMRYDVLDIWTLNLEVAKTIENQDEQSVCKLFHSGMVCQPPIDVMMGMSPLSRAKFRHRTDSNDWEHLNISKGTPLKKRLNLIAELKKKETEKEWTIDDFEMGTYSLCKTNLHRKGFRQRPLCNSLVSERKVKWSNSRIEMYHEEKSPKVQSWEGSAKRNRDSIAYGPSKYSEVWQQITISFV